MVSMRWMDDLQFYVLFNSFSVYQDDEKLIMISCVQWSSISVEKILPRAGIELWPLDQ